MVLPKPIDVAIMPDQRIAIILPDLRTGGAERVTLTLVDQFVKRGVSVDLVLGRVVGELLVDVPAGVSVIDLEAPRLRSMLPALIRYLRRVRPAAVLAVMQEINCLAVLARQLSGVDCRLVLTEHTHASKHVAALPNTRGRFFMATAIRYCYPRGDSVVAVSEGVAQDLRTNVGLPHLPIEVIYNPVNVEDLIVRAGEVLEHDWLSETSDSSVLIAVGSLKPAKDFATLVRAFALLRERRKIRLIILGEGHERVRLEQLASTLGVAENVSFPGFVSNPWAWMSKASMFISSSRWEGFPMVLIEALALGLPTVATDCPSGPAEILSGGRYGKLVEMENPDALAEAIAETLESPPDTGKLINRALDFSPEELAHRYLNLLFPRQYTARKESECNS